jgi:hypothetical protein
MKVGSGCIQCKKGYLVFPVPSRDVTNQTLLLSARESLVCGIPAGAGKIGNLFYSAGAISKVNDTVIVEAKRMF